MPTKRVYAHILQGHEATEENAINHARGMAWNEVELSEPDNGEYFRRISGMTDCKGVINGVGIYYDIAADYYFFTDEEG